MEESKLRHKIRKAITARVLPERRPERMWGGSGTGAECALCGEPVTSEQTELELEFADSGSGPASYTVHVHCFSVWEIERGRASGSPLPGANDHGTIMDRERERTPTRGPG